MNAHGGFGFGKTELYFSEAESDTFYRNLLEALGFEYGGPRTLPGRSGFEHSFQAVGIRPGNCVLVAGGAQSLSKNDSNDRQTPKQRLEAWTKNSLFSMYDVGAVLQEQGLSVDLFVVHDVFTKLTPTTDFKAVTEEYSLRASFSMSLSVEPIETLPPDFIYGVARGMDAAFLSFDALSLSDLALLTNNHTEEAIGRARTMLQQLRVTQYFDPPADELILSAIAEGHPASKDLIIEVAEKSIQLAHPLSPNTYLRQVDYQDPVAVLDALQSHKYVDYKATFEISEDGKKIIHTIHMSPQENWLFKLLRAIRVGDLAKGLIDSLSKTGGGS
jgi:hypothetical protein